VVADRERATYADPARIHRVHHDGPYYKIDGVYNLTEPSPQRTPVLFQAGASQRGNRFAARHAECVFTGAPDRKALARIVTNIRSLAVEEGRRAGDIKIFSGLTVVTDRNAAAAREKFEDYKQYASAEGSLAHMVSGMGVDLERFGLDEEITEDKLEAMYPDRLRRTGEARGGRFPPGTTRRSLLAARSFGAGQSAIVGTPSEVAGQIADLVEETGLDGFNLTRTVAPECFRDFIELVIPELQERGLYKTAYAEGTLREKLFGPGRAHLPDNHHGASYRTWK